MIDLKRSAPTDANAGMAAAEAANRLERNVEKALNFARDYGSTDGDHHKAWVIDQMVRSLTGRGYAQWVKAHNDGKDGPDTYAWSVGVAP